MDGIEVRVARSEDVPGIRGVYEAVYGPGYPYSDFFDEGWLQYAVHSERLLVLVAVGGEGAILGTGSLVFDVSGRSDLVAELGRLAVLPSAQGRGVGRRLLEARLRFAEQRLHAVLVDNRTAHSASQRISEAAGLACVGFLPNKFEFGQRESIAQYARVFPRGLALRRNHPRVVPEVQAVAWHALTHCGIEPDLVVDEGAVAYGLDGDFVLQDLDASRMAPLIRIERGRVRGREVFGPVSLNHGLFQVEARRARYLVARAGADGPVVGAIGWIENDIDRSLHVVEMVGHTDAAHRFLWEALIHRCQQGGTVYLQVDVSAHAPRLQRTVVELGLLPGAYLPAAVFAEVERLDVVRFFKLFIPPAVSPDIALTPAAQVVADVVIESLRRRTVLPRVAAALERLTVFAGLTDEQARRLAGACELREVAAGERLFRQGQQAERLYLLLSGAVVVDVGGRRVGQVHDGDCIGELALLTSEPHSAGASVAQDVVAATLSRVALQRLTRQRPDIGVVVYRNLAVGLGRKLARLNAAVVGSAADTSSY